MVDVVVVVVGAAVVVGAVVVVGAAVVVVGAVVVVVGAAVVVVVGAAVVVAGEAAVVVVSMASSLQAAPTRTSATSKTVVRRALFITMSLGDLFAVVALPGSPFSPRDRLWRSL